MHYFGNVFIYKHKINIYFQAQRYGISEKHLWKSLQIVVVTVCLY